MRPLLSVLSLLFSLVPCAASSASEFRIGEYRAIALLGESGVLPDVRYVSFTGDYGFSRRLPSKEAIDSHIAQESPLLANFHLKVINLEFMLPGSSGADLDREIDNVATDILKRTGYNVISRANNHAMDFGPEGVHYNTRLLQRAGFAMIGTRSFPLYNWEAAGLNITVFSLTDYTDQPDPDNFILKINESDLHLIKKGAPSAGYRIAFVHLGSLSFYPSPHERSQVTRILQAGADLVVCTGNHFIKGFVYENEKPVAYGIGNHLFSSYDGDTEPVGMHFVAGFKGRELVQLFVVPFHNAILHGTTGPLDETAFASFKDTLADRSNTDPSRYYSDPRSLVALQESLGGLSFSKLKELRARHFVYATGILFHNHPTLVTTIGFIFLLGAVMITRRIVLRRRTTH